MEFLRAQNRGIWNILAVAAILAGVLPQAATQAAPCTYCDLNHDYVVDNGDLLDFVGCMTGPGVAPSAGCQRFDLDADGDVDQRDFGLLQACYHQPAGPADPIISEFMAVNSTTLKDEDNQYPDWIELYNPGPTAMSLEGWHLTDKATKLTKWTFPAVSLAANSYLVVFASEKDRAVAGAPLHTNFKLDADGEYLALVKPDGVTVVSEFGPTFPPQAADVAYGLAMGATDALVPVGAACRAYVPTAAPLPTDWMLTGFNDTAWLSGTTAVGYERSSGFETLIGLDVNTAMANNNTVLIRIPFTVTNPSAYTSMTLYMRYDDGFAAYLNGQLLASANTPSPLVWNSAAPNDHPDSQALTAVTYDGTSLLGALQAGQNILAIQGLNTHTGSSDFLILPELYAANTGLTVPRTERYFVTASPGAVNGTGAGNMGPLISNVQFSPAVPTDTQDITVTVNVAQYLSPIAAVTMYYRVMYTTEVAIAMLDDGAHGDGAAGDGVYGAVIPASASTPGQMVRWYIKATDSRSQSSRWPLYDNPTDSAQYMGTVVYDPSLTSPLPILQWFVQNTSAAETDNGTRASVYYLNQFYDNVLVHRRGNTSTGWPKRNLKFNFNSGESFQFDPDYARVDEINMNSTYSDKSYIRQILSWETYARAGAVGCICFPMRMQQNNAFYSVAIFVEEPEERLLERVGLDPEGALYKLTSQLEYANSDVAEKKTRETEGWEDIQALVANLQLTGDTRKNYLFDNLDIPACINYWAATIIVHDNDPPHKNYYMYRDTNDTGEWRMLPWDKDLTFGRNFTLSGGVLNDTMWANVDPYSHPLWGDSDHPKCDGPWNRLLDALSDTPEIRAMYLRRLRTLMDSQLQPPDTATAELKYETRVDQLVAQMQADVLLDRARWAAKGVYYGTDQDFATAVGILKTQYLAPRRVHLFTTHGPSGDGLIPAAQATNPSPNISFGTIEHSPASGIQDQEYVELVNANSLAVDISGWQLQVYDESEAKWEKKHTFHPGTVLRASSSLYATPKASAFRARTVSPKGGEGRLVQGNYDHHLAPGEQLRLVDDTGAVKAMVTIGG